MPVKIGEGVFAFLCAVVLFLSTSVLVIGLFLAGFSALLRGFVYLKTDDWITSACETASALMWETSAWCNISTDWKGFDRLYNWATSSLELSFLLALLGISVFVVSIALMVIVAKMVIPQNQPG